MDSPEGQQSIEVRDVLWNLLEDVQLDAKQRKLIWPDSILSNLFSASRKSTRTFKERVVREDTVLRLFPALLAHDVLKQVWAVATRFVLARRRVLRDIHRAVKAPEYSSAPIAATQLVLSRLIRIMSPNMVNEL